MSDDLQYSRLIQKMEFPEKGEIKERNTKSISTSFRLKVENQPRLDAITEYFKVANQSKALNLMIERFDDMKGDKLRAIQEIKQIMAAKGISKDEL